MSDAKATSVYEGRHLSMFNRGGWEYAKRNTARPAVGIVAVTDDGRVVLVEQHRPPVDRNVIELPPGLSGDISGSEDETLLEAAQRELLEETGYVASRWTELLNGYSPPGLTDESITLFLAEGLRRAGTGGGDPSEAITVHEVPLDEVLQWLRDLGAAADLKLLAGMFAAQAVLRTKGRCGHE
jgi:ADP-ribose pyrophosphatase